MYQSVRLTAKAVQTKNKTGVAWHWLNAEQRAKGQIISKHIIQIIM